MSTRRIIFYDDAPEFGGHEQLAVEAARHLAIQDDVEVHFFLWRGNDRLAHALLASASGAGASRVVLHLRDYMSAARQALRSYVSFREILALRGELRRLTPDVVVVVQGGIAVSSIGLIAARLAGCRTLSYIPMTHPEHVYTDSKVKAVIRAMLSAPYLRLPSRFITISPRMARYLKLRGVREAVVVENGVRFPERKINGGEGLREKHGFSSRDRVFAVVGRIEFWQKRQDVALAAFVDAHTHDPNIKLLFVGSGPDEPVLRSLVADSGVANDVSFEPWREEMGPVYEAIDCLVIASRYEGVPLVMLEAMYAGKPVVSFNRDGMADCLPEEWLADADDEASLSARMIAAVATFCPDTLEANRKTVVARYSIDRFRKNFQAAIEEAIQCSDV